MIEYKKDRYGFLKQIDPEPFKYDEEYNSKQSTNSYMSWLRLGWLSAFIPYDELKTFKVVDVGAGNRTFVNVAKKVFKEIVPYDLSGESISEGHLYNTEWDLVVCSDVLEHYENIDTFWSLKFKYALISYPEEPTNINIKIWRHYKPNEHTYILNSKSFNKWVDLHGAVVVGSGCPEDMIRTRWADAVNISTFLIKGEK
jgi:2-polyprenyl-3-methyl-5-hydroxy-6-metoxy-1,4-benzoquinol methylase